ncbi:hypothetical protein SAMN05421503_2461 [Terribacillus aidingensis]|uniref:Uncharacterized protein n=1 Tax=Terribacillus aidingensis TaxID=586416 RepID=A0A285NYL3_9BACI|nr:hypothetical protein [Terribacillus aidingensis]SNZ14539.1 hypothetical protein SAMN05421503_2461 [Terribacillus aidingensis]
MLRPIRIELYGEYVLARMDISQKALLDFLDSEDDDQEVMPELTPQHPKLAQFTQDEIESFEFIYQKDMAAIHGIKKRPSN